MKKIVLRFFVTVLFTLTCVNNYAEIRYHVAKDTIVNITSDISIRFAKYNTKADMWCVPSLIIENDTLPIRYFPKVSGSKLNFSISPKKDYFLMDYIVSEYTKDLDSDEITDYYQKMMCTIISIEKVEVVDLLQQACSGHWNSENQLVADGVIIFSD